MAVTFITGKNKPINAYDVDNTQITYSIVSQPGSDITDFNNSATSVSLDTSTAITGVSKAISVWALQSASASPIVISNISLVEDGVGTELLTDSALEDITNWTTAGSVTDNNDGTFTSDGTSVNSQIAQDIALTANRKYKLSVTASIPVNTTMRLETYHFDATNVGADGVYSQQTFVDFSGSGSGELIYDFEFFPMESTRVSSGSTVARALNGGPGSADYGTNNSASKTYRHINTFENTYPITIRATDQAGEIAERTFTVKATLPWRHISNISHAFVAGGYYNAESWRTVNRCDVNTDTTIDLGGLMANNGVTTPNANRSGMRYSDSSNDRWTGNAICYSTYAYDANNHCENFNMITSTMYGNGARLNNSTNANQAWADDTRRTGFYGGNPGVWEKFSHVTMNRITEFSGYQSYSYHAAFINETGGYTYSATGGNQTVNERHAFATDTRTTGAFVTNATFQGGTGNHTKAISTYGYGQDEAWIVGWNIVADTCIVRLSTGTAVTGPNQTINNGEGNCASGPVDSHGYSLGGYNGSPQNNHADRMNYAASTITRVSAADLRPHSGASSGGRMWAEL